MYLRFVQHARDPDTGLRTGLFVAAYRLANNNTHDLSIQARCHVLLAEADIMTEVLRTSRPGYIIYEDAFQIVSEPFADTPV